MSYGYSRYGMRYATMLNVKVTCTDASIVCDDWLKDARIIVSMVFIFRIKYNVTTLVANQVLIVWWNQQVFIFAESSRSAILM